MRRPFGALPEGSAVESVTLDSGELRAEILSYGGILRSLSLPLAGRRCELVLSLPDLRAYELDPSYQACIVGRCSNRIAGARFRLDGRSYALTANERGNQLHGGHTGFGKRAWQVVEAHDTGLRLFYHSPAGEEGYPGNLDVVAEFGISRRRLDLRFTARCDAPTPVSLTYHPYFNLSGNPQAEAAEQQLRVPAATFLPVNAALLPTGGLDSVEGTPLDFRSGHSLAAGLRRGHPQLDIAGGYDHCLVLQPGGLAAELRSSRSGLSMQILSDAPALQVYGGQGPKNIYPEPASGLCLEPQDFPDAVNQPAFPAIVLRPGATWSRSISYCFTLPEDAAASH